MNTAVKSNLKSKPYLNTESFTPLLQKEKGLVNFKSYQKLFVVLISLTTFLIFSESPRELENICEIYNSKEICNVW